MKQSDLDQKELNRRADRVFALLPSDYIFDVFVEDDVRVETIAILDGVIYIPGNNKFTKFLEKHRDVVVISSLLLSDYLFALQ